MKKITSFFFFFTLFSTVSIQAKDIVVKNPPFNMASTHWLKIDKIELKDTETVVHFKAFSQQIYVDSATHIVADGKKYPIKTATGIQLEQWIQASDYGGVISGAMHFDAIPKDTETLDFHETGTSIWGVELKSKKVKNRGGGTIVKNPPFSVASTKWLEVNKVELKDTETVVYFNAFCEQIYVDSNAHIIANGKKYPVKSSTGIKLEQWIKSSDQGGVISGALHFDAIPKDTKTLDFHETGTSVWGVELKSKKLTSRIELPKEAKAYKQNKKDTTHLRAQGFKTGVSTLKGTFLGYQPDLKLRVEVSVNNPITGEQEQYKTKVSDAGEFELSIPLVSSMQVLFRIPSEHFWLNDKVLLSPDEETSVYFDLQQKFRQEALLRRDKCPESKWIYFAGANVDVNNQYFDEAISDLIHNKSLNYERVLDDIAGMTVAEYKDYFLNLLNKITTGIEKKKMTPRVTEISVLQARMTIMDRLMSTGYYLEDAYERAKRKNGNNMTEEFKRPIPDLNYYDFLNNLQANNPINLYLGDYSYLINDCKFIGHKLNPTARFSLSFDDIVKEMLETSDMPKEDELFAQKLRSEFPENWTKERIESARIVALRIMDKIPDTGEVEDDEIELIDKTKEMMQKDDADIKSIVAKMGTLADYFSENAPFTFAYLKDDFDQFFGSTDISQEDITAFNTKYQDEINVAAQKIANKIEKERMQSQENLLKEIFHAENGIVFELLETQKHESKFESMTPLSEEELAEIAEMENPFYYSYLKNKSEEIALANEIKRQKGGFNAYTLPETDEDKIMYEILKPFEGKVILVDFWETWCGPCRSAMKQFEPAKEELKEQGVVFVYIASESSPLDTWNNMLPSIAGEHYRVTNEQMSALRTKYNFSGVPSYLVFGKDGEQSYFTTGFNEYEIINALNNEIAK